MNQRTSGLNFANYVSDEGKKTFFYKIGLIGPSRVGKTSIIAALLDEAKAALAKSYVSIAPFVDENNISPTKERIRNTILDIESGLDFCTFEPTGRGTADPFIFDLVMTIATGEEEKKAQLRLAILDYPGGWLENPPQGRQKEWDNCQEWIQESSVIIVPIDANLIMEADNKDRAKASRELLEVSRVEELVRGWAKGRWSKEESGLLLFVPVKCETYFNDNGGNNDKSEILYQRICRYYIDVIQAAEQEMSEKEEAREETSQQNNMMNMFKMSPPKPSTYTIEYHPVDTIGCIELANANWNEYGNGQLTLNCQYLVRNGNNFAATRKPLGTIGLLNSICKQMVENRQNSGIFRRFGDWFLRTNKLLANAIDKLSQQEPGSRFKQIASGNIAKRG